MLVKIKNRSAHAQLLKSKEGEVIQINAGVIKEVSDEFLVSYDMKAIQLLSRKPLQTEVTKEVLSNVVVEEAIEAPKTSKSSKKSSSESIN